MTARLHLSADEGRSLAMALVEPSQAPVLLLGDDLVIQGVSRTFCDAYAVGPLGLTGSTFGDLGNGEWNGRQLKTLLRSTLTGGAAVHAYELDLIRQGKKTLSVILNAQKIAGNKDGDNRLLVTCNDVTDARIAEKLKDDLVREKGMLLQELQHRIANSLQIIASVLLQSARQVQSEETRTHLHSAHHRVMSVASLQKQLSASSIDDVALRPYFEDLCASIGASMIDDSSRIVLTATVDGSTTDPDTSVSLGLIVTELVINSLKHAFPSMAKGTIAVDYCSTSSSWTLKVQDDGVGMTGGSTPAKPGLGTGIVDALAKQLGATVTTTDARPGTRVTLTHI